MASPRALVINADDFGRSSAINHAVVQAHQNGVLTSASLMVNGQAAAEAVALAHANPRLGVGLHLTLLRGVSTLKPTDIPGLVDAFYRFSDAPVRTGLRYFLNPRLRPLLRLEIQAQVRQFLTTGLPLDHINGHLNVHLHPTILKILLDDAVALGLKRLRLTRDPLRLNLRLAQGRLLYRVSHALVFAWLSRRARPALVRSGLRHTDYVFGLLQNGRVTEEYLLRLIPALPSGNSELYSHPTTSGGAHRDELEALISPRVRAALAEHNIQLIRYQDL